MHESVLYAISCHVCLILTSNLAGSFILSADFYNDITINTEVTFLVPGIFYGMSCRSQLIGKEGFSDCSNLWLLLTECV